MVQGNKPIGIRIKTDKNMSMQFVNSIFSSNQIVKTIAKPVQCRVEVYAACINIKPAKTILLYMNQSICTFLAFVRIRPVGYQGSVVAIYF